MAHRCEESRAKFGQPAQLTLLYHWARLIELLSNAENTIRLLDDPEITSTETRVKCTPRAARGVGVTEAPRGTLIHDYTTDADGLITNVNLIVGTTHNNAPINMMGFPKLLVRKPALAVTNHPAKQRGG